MGVDELGRRKGRRVGNGRGREMGRGEVREEEEDTFL